MSAIKTLMKSIELNIKLYREMKTTVSFAPPVMMLTFYISHDTKYILHDAKKDV